MNFVLAILGCIGILRCRNFCKTKRAIFTNILLIYDLEQQPFSRRVHWHIDDFVPVRAEIVLERNSLALFDPRKQYTSVGIGFTHGLQVSKVAAILKVYSYDSDRSNISICT